MLRLQLPEVILGRLWHGVSESSCPDLNRAKADLGFINSAATGSSSSYPAQFTGAANSLNAGVAVAGLGALAALVM